VRTIQGNRIISILDVISEHWAAKSRVN